MIIDMRCMDPEKLERLKDATIKTIRDVVESGGGALEAYPVEGSRQYMWRLTMRPYCWQSRQPKTLTCHLSLLIPAVAATVTFCAVTACLACYWRLV